MISRALMVIRKHGVVGTASRIWRRVSAVATAAHMQARNMTSREPVTGDADAIVSLTSYGPRLRSLHLVLESVAAGSLKPKRLIVWSDEPAVLASPPAALRRLMKRGLELRPADPLRSHKKYYPALNVTLDENVSRLITIDDDVMYPGWWLDRLMSVCRDNPTVVVAYRARRVSLLGDGFAPWSEWPLCESDEPSLLHMGIGEAGIAYPRKVVGALLERGLGFMDAAPRADDIWLHATAVSVGVATRQVTRHPLHLVPIPGSQSITLAKANIGGGGNDLALVRNYDATAMKQLRCEAGDSPDGN